MSLEMVADPWRTRQLSASVDNIVNGGRQDCQVDTDSSGVVYVFWDGFEALRKARDRHRSFDGGNSIRPRADPDDGSQPWSGGNDGRSGRKHATA